MLHVVSYTWKTKHICPFLRATACNGFRVLAFVWASICPSVTLQYCVKTTQARILKFLLWTASRTPVYPDKISCLWGKRFFL